MGVYKLKTGPSYKLKTGPSFFLLFFSLFYSVFLTFFVTQIVSQCVKIVFLQNFGLSKMRFSKRKLHFLFFSFLCWKIQTEKRKKTKRENSKKPYKNRFFLRWSSKNVKNQKKWIFSKNCLTLFVSGREKKRAFSCTLSVLAKIFFWTKTVQSRKHYKNRGFSGNCQKAKMTPFFSKRCFLTWLKKWVLLTVFLKSCVFLKTLFL